MYNNNIIVGSYIAVNEDKKEVTILQNNKTYTFEELNELVREYKNINKIYKPLPIIEYTAYKNNNQLIIGDNYMSISKIKKMNSKPIDPTRSFVKRHYVGNNVISQLWEYEQKQEYKGIEFVVVDYGGNYETYELETGLSTTIMGKNIDHIIQATKNIFDLHTIDKVRDIINIKKKELNLI